VSSADKLSLQQLNEFIGTWLLNSGFLKFLVFGLNLQGGKNALFGPPLRTPMMTENFM